MDYNNFRKKVYYVNLRDMTIYTLITIGVIILITLVSIFNKDMGYDIIALIGLIMTMILIMFSIHLKNLTNREIYRLFKVFFIINCIIYIVFLTPEDQFISFKFFLNNTCRYMNVVIMYYLTSKYRKQENVRKIIYIEYIFLLVLSSIVEYYKNIYPSMSITIIYFLLLVVFILLAYKHTYYFDFRVNGKIDLLKLNIYLVLIIITIKIMANIFNLCLINYIANEVMQIFFLSTLVAIIINITKESYNFIFKETLDTSKYLESINRKIIKNNEKLEETYNKLKDRPRLYKSFLGSLPNSIVIINSKLRISYCNHKFLEEIGNRNIRDVVNSRIDNYINFNLNLNNGILDVEELPKTTTINFNNKKMEIRFFMLNKYEKEFIMLFKDLSQEIKLSTMKEELQNIKEREEIKRNFLSNISHDIKIPVNIIYSVTQLEKILISNNDIKKIRDYNKISKENCFILTRFTNNLIDISKIDSKSLEVNLILDNIVEFIEDYLVSLTPYINNSGINVIFDTDEEEVYIYFDKEMMQRIVLNLVSNSIKFTNYGGTISVKIKVSENHVIIEIKDNGLGMNKEFVYKAFNKYEIEERARRNNQTGDGVGLFVVYNLIKAQNGDIEINSEQGKGTTFTIYLNR